MINHSSSFNLVRTEMNENFGDTSRSRTLVHSLRIDQDDPNKGDVVDNRFLVLEHIEEVDVHGAKRKWTMLHSDLVLRTGTNMTTNEISLNSWGREQGLHDIHIVQLLKLLNEPYLRSLPICKKSRA